MKHDVNTHSLCVCVCGKLWDLWIESSNSAEHAALSGPVVSQQEVLVFAGEAEFEVPERATCGVKCPDAHYEQDDVGGNQAADVIWVLERQAGHYKMDDDDGSQRPPALVLTGIEEDDAPEHVKQDDGHGHEG